MCGILRIVKRWRKVSYCGLSSIVALPSGLQSIIECSDWEIVSGVSGGALPTEPVS